MLAVVVPAASANAFKRPSFFNDASHKATAKPEAVRPEAPRPAAEAVEVRGLSRGPGASVVDIVPEGVWEVVEYLVGRFGVVLDREAAFKARDFVVAKMQARLEKVAAKEPELAHILAEVAEHVLSSFGRLMASPDAARHVYNALFYFFEGYQTRDGEVLFKMIEHTVREAVRRRKRPAYQTPSTASSSLCLR